jgi:hypothetical protein
LITPPRTLDAAVERVIENLSSTQQSAIMSTPREDMCDMLFCVGAWIRANLGIHDRSNIALFDACKTDNTDTVCIVILDALWQKLHQS